MILLALAFTIFVSHLLTLAAADSDNHFVYPPANPNYSSYSSNVDFGTLAEGTSITLQWMTTWKSVSISLSQNNDPIPLPLPNSQNLVGTSSYTWIVDLSGQDGNPGFNLARGQEFNFLVIQDEEDGAWITGSFWSEWFTITNSVNSSSSLTTSSITSTSSTTTLTASSATITTAASKNSASISKLSKGALIGISVSLLAIIIGIESPSGADVVEIAVQE
ncbi:hypothetical protein V502_02644 [Pseudogymnoascus sp. VKM F-4520 (FW-2644)]|nr:hypothetical protein V502_02644 [Pseudogymnoascus sp. VKM F-4520 (FW-2644)]